MVEKGCIEKEWVNKKFHYKLKYIAEVLGLMEILKLLQPMQNLENLEPLENPANFD